ncbi:hypothetical protein CVT26_003277 [Gymnopilus dilepis]|uniref:Malonyl-CoA:ACP transacylase (MAT) domain-containing protein n=1 Tax=Gymnopilus dilepis TaxID=231916 RepID=A0A409Y503_9AGAR|nr:hypothetical protein CVT26_003277 [Gymnopilus dilepis]
MRKEGLPIEGFCVAAGIPTTEKAVEIIEGLKAAGIKHVAFKPGSVDGIRQVINIAAANPDFPIIMQWTGGHAGGHHSFEDFHQPVLATYRAIRQHPNICLVGGSGSGSAEDVWEYLTGDWSVQRFGVQPMPFDGFLFASRVMVAKEAHTSSSVKDLIVAAPGVVDGAWQGTYTKPTGGILTVRSELGEPIHKVATRAVKLWKEFDDTVSKLPKEKRALWLTERKEEIIGKLNRDFAKAWFGWKKDGSVALDLADMTYEETVLRMIRLMFVAHQKRWVDLSQRNLSLDDPLPFVETFFQKYPLASEQLLAAEDTAYFLAISEWPGQKPVPFIPVLDASFEVWFNKDSLWAAEDVEAVFDQDPQRVCILQRPVAAKWSVKKDEPVKELLGNINKSLVQRLLERSYGGDVSSVPVVEYLAAAPKPVSKNLSGVKCTEAGSSVTYELGSHLPETSAWLETLSGSELSWLRALLTSTTIVQGTSYIDNPLRRILAPRAGQKVVVTYNGSVPSSVAVYGAARSYGGHVDNFKALEIVFIGQTKQIALTFFEEHLGSSIPLSLQFEYKPLQGFAPIHEIATGHNQCIKEFYWKLWYGNNETLPSIDLREKPKMSNSSALSSATKAKLSRLRGRKVQAPMDFTIVTGWQAIMKSVFPAAIDGDLLKLVHLSNGFRMVDGAKPLALGDVCRAEARIVSVINAPEGKIVKVKGHVYCEGQPVIEVVSSFLYRGRFTDYENTFDTTEEQCSLGKRRRRWSASIEGVVAFKDRTNYRNVLVTGDLGTALNMSNANVPSSGKGMPVSRKASLLRTRKQARSLFSIEGMIINSIMVTSHIKCLEAVKDQFMARLKGAEYEVHRLRTVNVALMLN